MTDAEAADALRYIEECEVTGDFADFSVADLKAWYAEYYT